MPKFLLLQALPRARLKKSCISLEEAMRTHLTTLCTLYTGGLKETITLSIKVKKQDLSKLPSLCNQLLKE